jgi:NitT/TauT family transport system permease protein
MRTPANPARPLPWLPVVAPVGLGVVVLGAWQVTSLGAPPYLLPSPRAVVRQLSDGLLAVGDLWGDIGVTMAEALLGCALGFALALPLAVLVYRSRIAAAATWPFLGATQAIPAVALAPLLVLWVGFGLTGIVLLCALIVFFPILVSSVVGLRHIDRDVWAAALVDGAGSVALLVNIEIPLALHTILGGVRNGFTLSVTGAVVGEMVMGGSGLGSRLFVQRNANDTAGMFATIIVLTGLAATIYWIVSAAERRWSDLSLPLVTGAS